MSHPLEPLINPQSVAIIGASASVRRVGGRPLHYLIENGYGGAIYPVNPTRDAVQGIKAYPSILDVPEAVDCAVVAVPAAIVLETVRDCAKAGARCAVIFSSGFAETGADGARMQAELTDITRSTGMRILGPNCLGVLNLNSNWFGTFANGPAEAIEAQGKTGIVSQSGAFGSHIFMAAQRRGIGASFWVTTGNEADIDVAEVIDFYAQSSDVRTIVAYVESVQNGAAMCRALATARRMGKPVIIMKVGSSDIGAKAAASHTASIVGQDAVYDAVFRQYGAHRAATTTEVVDLAYACQFGIFPRGKRVCLKTISGGAGIQMADVAEAEGLTVPPLAMQTQAEFKALIPQGGVLNPVDFTGAALNEPEKMAQIVERTLTCGQFDAHVIYLASLPGSPFTKDVCLKIFADMRAKHPDAMVVLSMLATDEVAADYEALGLPCLRDPAEAVHVMGVLTRFGESFARAEAEPTSGDMPADPDDMPLVDARAMTEVEAKQLLAKAGLRIPQERCAETAQEAVDFAASLGRAVALKIASPDIPHKTEIGGVLLNVVTADEVKRGFETLMDRANNACPDAHIEGVTVSEMVPTGVEAVIGLANDPAFGPVVMFGLGGIFVEVLRDVSFRLAPIGKAEARRMIDEIRGRAMLDGVRGQPAINVDLLADALSRLSAFGVRNAQAVESVDINPLILTADAAYAVDGLIVPRISGAT